MCADFEGEYSVEACLQFHLFKGIHQSCKFYFLYLLLKTDYQKHSA